MQDIAVCGPLARSLSFKKCENINLEHELFLGLRRRKNGNLILLSKTSRRFVLVELLYFVLF